VKIYIDEYDLEVNVIAWFKFLVEIIVGLTTDSKCTLTHPNTYEIVFRIFSNMLFLFFFFIIINKHLFLIMYFALQKLL